MRTGPKIRGLSCLANAHYKASAERFPSKYGHRERKFCESTVPERQISAQDDEFEALLQLPLDQQKNIFQPLDEFMDKYSNEFLLNQNNNNNNIDNDKELLEEWFSASESSDLSLEEMEIDAKTTLDSIEKEINQAISSQKLSHAGKNVGDELSQAGKHVGDELTDMLEMGLTNEETIAEAESDIDRHLDNLGFGLPIKMTSSASKSPSTRRPLKKDENCDSDVSNNNDNNTAHQKGGTDIEHNTSANSTAAAEAASLSDLFDIKSSTDDLRFALKEIRTKLDLVASALREAMEAHQRLESLVDERGSSARGGGNASAHNKCAVAAKVDADEVTIIDKIAKGITPFDSTANVSGCSVFEAFERKLRKRKEDEDIGENVSAHNKTGVAFGREEAEIAVADSDSICASERSVSESTKEADGSSVFDAFEETLRKRREEDLEERGESVDHEDPSTISRLIEQNRQYITENESSLCEEHLADFTRHQILFPPSLSSSTPTSGLSERPIDIDQYSIEEEDLDAYVTHADQSGSDGKDVDNDDGDDDNGDKQNAKEAPSPGELTERRDVRGISNDVYKGRSVKCDEYGIQDIELQIGKMRDEPREPDSPD